MAVSEGLTIEDCRFANVRGCRKSAFAIVSCRPSNRQPKIFCEDQIFSPSRNPLAERFGIYPMSSLQPSIEHRQSKNSVLCVYTHILHPTPHFECCIKKTGHIRRCDLPSDDTSRLYPGLEISPPPFILSSTLQPTRVAVVALPALVLLCSRPLPLNPPR